MLYLISISQNISFALPLLILMHNISMVYMWMCVQYCACHGTHGTLHAQLPIACTDVLMYVRT